MKILTIEKRYYVGGFLDGDGSFFATCKRYCLKYKNWIRVSIGFYQNKRYCWFLTGLQKGLQCGSIIWLVESVRRSLFFHSHLANISLSITTIGRHVRLIILLVIRRIWLFTILWGMWKYYLARRFGPPITIFSLPSNTYDCYLANISLSITMIGRHVRLIILLYLRRIGLVTILWGLVYNTYKIDSCRHFASTHTSSRRIGGGCDCSSPFGHYAATNNLARIPHSPLKGNGNTFWHEHSDVTRTRIVCWLGINSFSPCRGRSDADRTPQSWRHG